MQSRCRRPVCLAQRYERLVPGDAAKAAGKRFGSLLERQRSRRQEPRIRGNLAGRKVVLRTGGPVGPAVVERLPRQQGRVECGTLALWSVMDQEQRRGALRCQHCTKFAHFTQRTARGELHLDPEVGVLRLAKMYRHREGAERKTATPCDLPAHVDSTNESLQAGELQHREERVRPLAKLEQTPGVTSLVGPRVE